MKLGITSRKILAERCVLLAPHLCCQLDELVELFARYPRDANLVHETSPSHETASDCSVWLGDTESGAFASNYRKIDSLALLS